MGVGACNVCVCECVCLFVCVCVRGLQSVHPLVLTPQLSPTLQLVEAPATKLAQPAQKQAVAAAEGAGADAGHSGGGGSDPADDDLQARLDNLRKG